MARRIAFESESWEEYLNLQATDKNLYQKLNNIIKEMLRSHDPTQGIGQPEPLKYEYTGYYSRRLSKKDRVIYRFDDNYIYIIAIGGHYND